MSYRGRLMGVLGLGVKCSCLVLGCFKSGPKCFIILMHRQAVSCSFTNTKQKKVHDHLSAGPDQQPSHHILQQR